MLIGLSLIISIIIRSTYLLTEQFYHLPSIGDNRKSPERIGTFLFVRQKVYWIIYANSGMEEAYLMDLFHPDQQNDSLQHPYLHLIFRIGR